MVAVSSKHVILMPLSVVQKLCEVLDELATNQPDWKAVGKALGGELKIRSPPVTCSKPGGKVRQRQ